MVRVSAYRLVKKGKEHIDEAQVNERGYINAVCDEVRTTKETEVTDKDQVIISTRPEDEGSNKKTKAFIEVEETEGQATDMTSQSDSVPERHENNDTSEEILGREDLDDNDTCSSEEN